MVVHSIFADPKRGYVCAKGPGAFELTTDCSRRMRATFLRFRIFGWIGGNPRGPQRGAQLLGIDVGHTHPRDSARDSRDPSTRPVPRRAVCTAVHRGAPQNLDDAMPRALEPWRAPGRRRARGEYFGRVHRDPRDPFDFEEAHSRCRRRRGRVPAREGEDVRRHLGGERVRRQPAGRQAPRRRSRGQGLDTRRQRRSHGPARVNDRR